MAVRADQDLDAGPVGADGPDEAAQVAADLDALGPLGRAQHRGDEAALPVEHDDRLEPIFVVVGVEHPELLAAMHGVESIIHVEHDALGHLPERGAVQVHHGACHAQQGAHVGHVLQPRDRRLRGEVTAGGRDALRHLEHGVLTQARGVVAVLVAGRDHQHAEADHVSQGMCDQRRIARIVQAPGQAFRHAEPSFDLAQHQHARVRRQRATVETGLHRAARGFREAE